METLIALFSMALSFLSPHSASPPKPSVSGLSTIFGSKGDKWAGGTLACSPRKIVGDQHVCAHRTLPCGTLLALENPRNGKRSWCLVMDRGPYGALDENGEWFVKTDPDEPGKYRGVLDISPASAKLMEHNGFQKIRAYRINMGDRARKALLAGLRR